MTSGVPSGVALEEALIHLPRHAKPGSLVFIFSDFKGLTAAGESAISRLAKHSDGVLLMISDPLEQHLPRGRHRLGDGVVEGLLDGRAEAVRLYAEGFEARRDRIKGLAKRHGLRFVHFETYTSPMDVLKACGSRSS